MRTTYPTACARRPRRRVPTVAWARDLVANPARYGADQRVRAVVAALLIEAGATR